jgi:hypothetical protein
MLGVVCHGQKDVRVEELAGDRSKVVKLHLALNS